MSTKSTIRGTPTLVVERMKSTLVAFPRSKMIQTRISPGERIFLPTGGPDFGNVVDLRGVGDTPGRQEGARKEPPRRGS